MSRNSDNEKKQWGLSLVWIAGWLFTLGYLNLSFKDGFFGIVIWPYQLGVAMAGF